MMKNIHELIQAINALKVDPNGGYVPARRISAEIRIGGDHRCSYPMAVFSVKVGDRTKMRLYAEGDPIGKPDWQERMLSQALTNIMIHDSVLYIALGEPEIVRLAS